MVRIKLLEYVVYGVAGIEDSAWYLEASNWVYEHVAKVVGETVDVLGR